MPTGFTTVSAAHLQDATGTPIDNATISFLPVANNGSPLSFRTGGMAGQTIAQAVSAQVVNGAFSIQLADTALTTPINVGYRVVVTDNAGHTLLEKGYACIQPTGDTWSLDSYVPNFAAQLTVQNGPPGLSIAAVGVYQAGTAYAQGNNVSFSGSSYTSRIDDNLGNQPDISPEEWQVSALAGANGIASYPQLSALISRVPATQNWFIYKNCVSGKYVNRHTGELVDDGGYLGGFVTSDFTPCNAGGPMSSTLPITSVDPSGLAFYDGNYQSIPDSGLAGGITTWSCPAGAAFQRASFLKSSKPETAVMVFGSEGALPTTYESSDTYSASTLDAKFTVASTLPDLFATLFTRPGYFNTSGIFVADANWLSTNILPLAALGPLSFSLSGVPSLNTITYFNANGDSIGGIVASGVGRLTTSFGTIPTGAIGVAFTARSSANPSAAPTNFSAQYFTRNITAATALSAVSATAATSAKKLVIDFVDYATITGYINNIGGLQADPNWLSTDYFESKAGDQFACNIAGVAAMNAISFYGSSHNFISGYSPTDSAPFVQVVTAPAGTAYHRVSCNNQSVYPLVGSDWKNSATYTETFEQVVSRFTPYQKASDTSARISLATPYQSRRKLALQPTDKVFLAGDSRSSTDYTWYRDAMARLTGATVYNGGFSGYSAASIASNAQLARIWTYDPALIIALIGGNDTGAPGTVGTFSGLVAGEPIVTETSIASDYSGTYFIQAISQFIRQVQARYYNIRARANLTGSETESDKAAKISALSKPYLVVCTDLPQQRYDAGNAYSLPANWYRKRAAIIECCLKYGVHCVDLLNKVPFTANMAMEVFYPGAASVGGATNLTNNQGVYFMDGLHPNQFGDEIIAEILCAEIGL